MPAVIPPPRLWPSLTTPRILSNRPFALPLLLLWQPIPPPPVCSVWPVRLPTTSACSRLPGAMIAAAAVSPTEPQAGPPRLVFSPASITLPSRHVMQPAALPRPRWQSPTIQAPLPLLLFSLPLLSPVMRPLPAPSIWRVALPVHPPSAALLGRTIEAAVARPMGL